MLLGDEVEGKKGARVGMRAFFCELTQATDTLLAVDTVGERPF